MSLIEELHLEIDLLDRVEDQVRQNLLELWSDGQCTGNLSGQVWYKRDSSSARPVFQLVQHTDNDFVHINWFKIAPG